jgi:hypothetical protein
MSTVEKTCCRWWQGRKSELERVLRGAADTLSTFLNLPHRLVRFQERILATWHFVGG